MSDCVRLAQSDCSFCFSLQVEWHRDRASENKRIQPEVLSLLVCLLQEFHCMLTCEQPISVAVFTWQLSCHGVLTRLSNSWEDHIAQTKQGMRPFWRVPKFKIEKRRNWYFAICWKTQTYHRTILVGNFGTSFPCQQRSLTTRQIETTGERPLPASDEFSITHALAFP